MLAVGAMPRLPASAAARSLRMSACRLVATMVSSDAGRLTMRAVAASTSSLSQVTSGNSLAIWTAISSHITIAWRCALLLVITVSSLRGRDWASRKAKRMDAFDPGPRHHRHIRGHFDRMPLMHPATHTGVLALSVLAHDDPVQIFRFAALERRVDAGKNACRAHVGVLIEALADLQPQAPQRDVVGDMRIAGGAEENGVLGAQSSRVRRRHHHAMLAEIVSTPVEVLELEAKIARRQALPEPAGQRAQLPCRFRRPAR